jgi:hypothetical protein
MAILLQQDFAQSNDEKGMRDSIKPQHIKSGTYYGQLQLRGSILVIKDNLNTESGYLAFGSSMSTIPTSPSTGTGIYIDYRGIYGILSGTPQFTIDATTGAITAISGTIGGWTITSTALSNAGGTVTLRGAGNLAFGSTPPTSATVGTGIFISNAGVYGLASNVQQFYLQASDGKAYAGAGAVTLDSDGITISEGTNDVNSVTWQAAALKVGQIYSNVSSGNAILNLNSNPASDYATGTTDVIGGSSGGNATLRLVSNSSERRANFGVSSGVYIGTDLTASPSETLHVVGTGYFSGNVRIGTTTTPNGRLRVDNTATIVTEMVSTLASGSSGGASLLLASDDGAAVVSGDRLGQLQFQGADDASHTLGTGAAIRGFATQTFSSTAHGGRLEFYTVPDSSTTLTLAMTINQDGKVSIGSGTGAGVTPDNFFVDINTSGSGDHLASASLINFTGSTSADSVQGLEGYVELNHSAGTLTRALGVIGHTDHVGAGVTTDSKVFVGSLITRDGAGAITNAFIYKSDGIVRLGTPGTITNGYTFYADALPASGVTTRWAFYAPGSGDKNHFAGQTFIGDTADANVTLGLTINQGAADDKIFTLKSSDVAHGMTDHAETDTYFAIGKVDGASGGADLYGYKDADGNAGGAIRVRGYLGEAADTTKTVDALGVVSLDAGVATGTGIATVGADGNLVVIRSLTTTKFIFDLEGSAHADVAWTTFDTHDDLALLNLLNAHLTPESDPLKANFSEWAAQSRDELERLKLVTFNEDGHNFLNLTRMHMLEVGALRQMGERLERMEKLLGGGNDERTIRAAT